MNKRFTVFLLVMTLFLSVSFAAHAQEAGFLGAWYLISAEYNGATTDIASLGFSITLTFYEGASAELSMGMPVSCIWTMQDNAVMLTAESAGIAGVCVLDEDRLTLTSDDGSVMIFGREAAEWIEGYAVREDVTFEDFYGSWRATNMTLGGWEGMKFPTEENGIVELVIQGSTATLVAQIETPLRVIDQKEENLACTMDGYMLVIARGVPARFVLHQNGTLSWLADDIAAGEGIDGFGFLFERAE